jgi:uncharacterized membrane protein
MSPGALAAEFAVPFYCALLCVAPAVTKPTVQFGVRIPPERTGATVISEQRSLYFMRTAVIGLCCTVVAVLLAVHGSRWSPMLIVPIEVAADIGCLLVARRRITAVKRAERWFAGLRPTVVADTSWRADPPRFPLRWLIPALTVTAATVLIGVVRYPELPERLADGFGAWAAPGHRVPKTPVTAFALVFAQLWVTALWTAMMLIIYRSRPDIEAADPAASVRRYRRLLARCTTAMLALVTLIDLSLLLAALRNWQVYRLSGAGAALPLLPYAVGLLVFVTFAMRSGQGGFRLAADGIDSGGPPDSARRTGLADRDDDRFWKGGLIYVNRDDPALMVGARMGVGWTFNLANPAAWLLISAIVGVPAGLVLIAVLTR